MCGACGGQTTDWSTPLVSGPTRRRSIARFVTDVCGGIKVNPTRQGWTVHNPTGGWAVVSTFDQLADSAASRLSLASWPELEAAVTAHSTGQSEQHPEYHPPARLDRASTDAAADRRLLGDFDGHQKAEPQRGLSGTARAVLTSPGDLHLRLTGFALGIRRFEPQTVTLDAHDRRAPFQLTAVGGRIVGSTSL